MTWSIPPTKHGVRANLAWLLKAVGAVLLMGLLVAIMRSVGA